MNIYLDIDGTMIHEDLWDTEILAADGLAEFVKALRSHTTYWLTTHYCIVLSRRDSFLETNLISDYIEQ